MKSLHIPVIKVLRFWLERGAPLLRYTAAQNAGPASRVRFLRPAKITPNEPLLSPYCIFIRWCLGRDNQLHFLNRR